MHYMKEKETQSFDIGTERIRMILTAIVYVVIAIAMAAAINVR